jgi:hypothetical protein
MISTAEQFYGPMLFLGFTAGFVAYCIGVWISLWSKNGRAAIVGCALIIGGCAFGIPCGILTFAYVSHHGGFSSLVSPFSYE